ncbi:TRAP transporter large permease [Lachnospiraceae bacterium NSJ-143]|nr:TRAP transporter large permease [Lachnospiraceae bacterium NSJ-143]
MMIAPLLLFVCLMVFMFLKIPIAWSLMLSSLIALIVDGGYPAAVIVQRMFAGADNFSLLAIPFFIMAGEIMARGGLSKRLVDFANSLVGCFHGGLSLVSILACTFFAAISGSSIATTVAIGGIMIPEMTKRGYPKDFSGAVQAIGGTLGIVIPPSIVFIMYGMATNVSVTKLLMSGMIPGIMTGGALCFVAYLISKKNNYPKDSNFSLPNVFKNFKSAFLSLMMPIIILGGIYLGIFTPTESAAVAVVYGLVVSALIYREVKLKDIGQILISTGKSTANLMILVVSAQMFGWVITIFDVPSMATDFVIQIANSPFAFITCTVILLLIAGMFMEDGATVLILGPILAPIASMFGIDPVHFGFVMVFTLAIGQATPPFGVTLFVASSLTKKPVTSIARKMIPFLLTEIACAFLFAYVPVFSTWLPYAIQ